MAQKQKKKKNWLVRFLGACCTLTLRTVMFTLMLVFGLSAVCWVLFIKFFNAQYLSEEITTQLQRALNRPVVITALDLKFFNTLELKGFSVLDSEVAHGEALVSADSVAVRFKLLPLLDHQLVIDEVTLNRPRINIVRGEDGRYNVPDIRAPKKIPGDATASAGERFAVSVQDWTVKNGVMSYKDLQNKTTHAVYGLNLHFERLRFDELSRFQMEMVLRNKWKDNISDMEIKGAGHVNFANFDWSNFALRSLRAQVFAFRKPVALTVDLDNLRTPYFNIRAQVPAFEGKDLSVFDDKMAQFYFPQADVSLKGVLSNNYRTLKINESAITAQDVRAQASGTLNFAEAPFTAEVQFSTGPMDLAPRSRNYPPLEKYKLTGSGAVEKAHLVRTGGQWQLPLLTLTAQNAGGDFYGFLADGVSGTFQAKQNFSDLYASTTSGKVTVDRSVFDNLQLSGFYRKGNVYANIAGGELNGIPLKMNLAINHIKSPKRKITTNIYLKHFEPMPFIGVVFDFAHVIGQIHPFKVRAPQTGQLAWLVNFRERLPKFMPNFAGTLSADTFSSTVISGNNFFAQFDLTGLLPGMDQLNGTLDATLQNGVIHQMEKLAEEQQALNITFTPFIIMHRMERAGSFKVGQVLKDVPFEDMAASVDFVNGRMNINNAFTQGPTISAAVQGWTNWVEENFDIIIWTMFNNTSRSGALAENLTDESGNPALAFKVSSSMRKPKLEMLKAKQTGRQIKAAQARGLRTVFESNRDFIKGDFHAKK